MCAGDTGHDRPGTSRGRWLVRSVDVPRDRYGILACGLYRADVVQVLVDAASDADLRTGQRVTVMVQHDWSGEFANQRIAERGQQADWRCLTHRIDNGHRACAGHVREDR